MLKVVTLRNNKLDQSLLCIVALILLLCQSGSEAIAAMSEADQLQLIRTETEASLDQPIPEGGYVIRPLSTLSFVPTKDFGIIPNQEEGNQTASIPGCTSYWFYFPNPSSALCTLIVEKVEFKDPPYSGWGTTNDVITFNITLAPGTYYYSPFKPVTQCATFMTVQYRYKCGTQDTIRQSMWSNWGPYGFTWYWHYIFGVTPAVDTLYIWGASSTFCTVPFDSNGVCSSPPSSVDYNLTGLSRNPAQTPFLNTPAIIFLVLLLAATAWFVLSRRKVRTTGSAA